VEFRSSNLLQVPRQHCRIDAPGLSSPRSLQAAQGSHGWHKREIGVLALNGAQFFQERCIFRPPVRVKEKEFM
jgi:hypothetical protein